MKGDGRLVANARGCDEGRGVNGGLRVRYLSLLLAEGRIIEPEHDRPSNGHNILLEAVGSSDGLVVDLLDAWSADLVENGRVSFGVCVCVSGVRDGEWEREGERGKRRWGGRGCDCDGLD